MWSRQITQIVSNNTRYLDLSLVAGADIGTVLLRGALGMHLRVGYIINPIPSAEDLSWLMRESPHHPLSGKKIAGRKGDVPEGWGGRGLQTWEFYFFVRPLVRFVGYNLFLDGTVFTESHRVDKHPIVLEGEAGFTFKVGFFRFLCSAIFQSPEGRYDRADPTGHRYLRFVLGYEGL
jgi:hypothetical protein